MSAEPPHICPSCGNEFSGAIGFCPVCILRKALPGAAESGTSTFEETVKPTPEQPVQRFEHYELVTGEDGKPEELGRGAMGVTYKALDINLRCPVTLKIISERYVGDESAWLRFVREARAAASVRHRMLPRSSTWARPARITSTRWSLYRGKPSKNSSDAQADWKQSWRWKL
jgi:hypothetical protein